MDNKTRHRKNNEKQTQGTKEDRIKRFILRNSTNGFFTKTSTISQKFEISNQETWDVIGSLLVDGAIEATHDINSGEMKVCETGKTYEILGKSKNRQQALHKNKKKEKAK